MKISNIFSSYNLTRNQDFKILPSLYLIFCLLIIPALSVLHQHDHSEETRNMVWNTTSTDLLKRDLLANYDKFARPAQHTNITKIELDLVFKHVDLDDTKSMMTVNSWVKMIWNDDKLKWNVNEYGNLNKLHVADHEVWEPDIVLYNSATANNIEHYGNVHILVYPNGRVLWVPPAQFSVYCSMDLTRWPYDRHRCKLVLGSWTYGGDMIDLVTNNTGPVETELEPSSWKVLSITRTRNVKYYKCCEEPYMDITYDIVVERHSSAFHALIIAPAIGVMLLCLSLFWIPPNCGSKFVVAGTTALIVTMLLVYFCQRLATFGTNTPLIVLYYCYNELLVALSLIVSIYTYNMATKHNSTPAPRALTKIFNSKISVFLMLPKYKAWPTNQRSGVELNERSTLDEDREDLTSVATHVKRPATAEWFIVAIAVNRIFFFIYVLLYVEFILKCIL